MSYTETIVPAVANWYVATPAGSGLEGPATSLFFEPIVAWAIDTYDFGRVTVPVTTNRDTNDYCRKDSSVWLLRDPEGVLRDRGVRFESEADALQAIQERWKALQEEYKRIIAERA
jgi:hypothetical protein